ncbi:ATP-binding domain-containing protein [Sphingomonas sp.]|uniref:ATP-binding domain-containing protein n=1 Tax=Sphingomonas sp. TaxID=28214 RepID=UPI003B00E7F2
MSGTWWVDPSQLDSDQRQVTQARSERDLLIVGPPGSGKTNILMLRANYVRSLGPRLLFLTFTRALTEFLKSSPNIGRADQIKGDEIQTFMGWAKRFLSERGATLPAQSDDFEETRLAHIAAVQALIQRDRIGRIYDAVIVDEVQDFRTDELQLLRGLTEHMNAAGDARQTIFNHSEGLRTMEGIASETVRLSRHYRIGRAICDYADRILPPQQGDQPMIQGCNYDETTRQSSVETVACVDLDDQYRRCIDNIRAQLRYIVDEPIMVMTWTRAVRDGFWAALEGESDLVERAMVQHQENYQPFGPETMIRVMTIHSAKGSEARAVHILDAESLRDKRELAFTAATRAKTEVKLYHSALLPGHLEVPANRLPPIENLF